jgi:hypothetical protein
VKAFKCTLKKLNEVEGKDRYCVKVSNRTLMLKLILSGKQVERI